MLAVMGCGQSSAASPVTGDVNGDPADDAASKKVSLACKAGAGSDVIRAAAHCMGCTTCGVMDQLLSLLGAGNA